MVKGILFDKDGTLIEFESMWHQILTLIFNELELKYKFNENIITNLKKISGFTPSGFEPESMIQVLSTHEIIECWIQQIEIEEKKVKLSSNHQLFSKEDLRELLFTVVEEQAKNPKIKVNVLDGVETTLKDLKEKGYYLGIATADTRGSTYSNLKKTNILGYFDFIAYDGDLFLSKPSPSMAIAFCKEVGIESSELLIVGDSLNDYHFAQNAGAEFVGIQSQYNLFKNVDSHGGKKLTLIKNFSAIQEVLDRE